MPEPIAVRHLSAAEVHLAIEWARQEGWSPGLDDAACFFAADPGGFLTSLHNDEPAAVVSLVRYGDAYAFLGLYICRPELRGQGYGWRVWQAAIEQAGSRTIGLDGVPQQQANYARSGFQLAWQNTRYRLQGGGTVSPQVIDLDEVPFAEIARYDNGVFESNRERFLRMWIAQPRAQRLGIVRNGSLAGWGLLRPLAAGYKIGPLLADDLAIAELLLDSLCALAGDAPVFLDIPEPNQAAMRLATRREMEPVFETARMYRGDAHQLDLDRVFGITTFELG
jgi:GNAT superfamily N-acetyltransferase